MDIPNIVVTIITGLFGMISGGGILYFRQEKKLKEVEAKRQEAEVREMESAEWKKLYDESKEDSRQKQNTIDTLTEDRDRWRTESANRDVIIIQKEMEIQRLTFFKCDLLECTNRRPPFLVSEAIEEK